eukprot:TRINITY_DN3710_c0_g1_i1.p1 TRINITY_DN3710_c0_g1~~TRINITY_DN3710_c0_g1_i1.p1  ORF type:complete len:317 (-),score=125.73 TRINITY_DN3710_c0_g1_i1:689-1639(-)
MAQPRSLQKLTDLTRDECLQIVSKAVHMKRNPADYADAMKGKTMLMLFEKPSLRTRVSFEAGMNQMGGYAIFYSIADSPLGKMKENIHDTAKCTSRYVEVIAARVYNRQDIRDLAKHSTVPVINLLDDYAHPCQILADWLTIYERMPERLSSGQLKLSFFGDGRNNVTYDLMRAAALFGMRMDIACPADEAFYPEQEVLDEVAELSKKTGAVVRVVNDVLEAARDSDVIYTDTWMSYGIKPDQEAERKRVLSPFQVDSRVMQTAKADALFMHCLPTTRGNEQTAEVVDGPQSVVFDQAENRLHVQKVIVLFLLGKI